MPDANIQKLRRLCLWVLVFIYTGLLPFANIVYDSIVAYGSRKTAGLIPVVLIIIMAVGFLLRGWQLGRLKKCLVHLLPCAAITISIVVLEPNPNKYIHIPEYIIMAWLVFKVLSIDYRQRGIYILVFTCASLLGGIDEILQGLLAERFYGWRDIVVNSFSVLVGIFIHMALEGQKIGSWQWTGHLTAFKTELGVFVLGILGALFTFRVLDHCDSSPTLTGTYPGWMLAWNVLFFILALGVMVRKWYLADFSRTPAAMWAHIPTNLLAVLHGLVLMAVIFGLDFE